MNVDATSRSKCIWEPDYSKLKQQKSWAALHGLTAPHNKKNTGHFENSFNDDPFFRKIFGDFPLRGAGEYAPFLLRGKVPGKSHGLPLKVNKFKSSDQNF